MESLSASESQPLIIIIISSSILLFSQYLNLSVLCERFVEETLA